MRNTDQQVTVLLLNQNSKFSLYVTFVYAKCDNAQRMEIRNDLYHICGGMDRPWLIRGDLNVVLSREEKIGGLLVVTPNYQEFKTCIDSCDLSQVQFRGSPFTWWNSKVKK